MKSGVSAANELITTFSAPAERMFRMSCSERIPPPTANGIFASSPTFAHEVERDQPALSSGENVEEHQLVRAKVVEDPHGIDRIPDVALPAEALGLHQALDCAGAAPG